MHLGLNVTPCDYQPLRVQVRRRDANPETAAGFQALVSASWFSGVIANATF